MKILGRRRLYQLLEKTCVQSNITLACAPMGYGKTTSVQNYLGKKAECTIWFSMEGETDEEWMWMKLQNAISQTAEREHEIIHGSIPQTRKENYEWMEAVETAVQLPLHIVLDDFVWDEHKRIEQWLAFFASEVKSKVHVWVIARVHPKGEILEQVFKNHIQMLRVVDFAFTNEEVEQFARQNGRSITPQDISYIQDYTRGWAAAIWIVLEGYKEDQGFRKQVEIDTLIEVAFYNKVEAPMKECLMKLSILKQFTLVQAEFLCENHEIVALLIRLAKNNGFVYEVDKTVYRIAPVLTELLKKELLMSDLNSDELHMRAGGWYLSEGRPLEAIREFMYSKDYEQIIKVLTEYDEQSFMDTAPTLLKEVFIKMPEEQRNEYPYVYMRWIQDAITNISVEEGKQLLEAYKEEIQAGKVNGDSRQLMGEYYYVAAFTKFNDARKMHEYFNKAYECFQQAGSGHSGLNYPQMVDTFGSDHLLYLYHRTPGDLKALVEEIQEKAKYYIHISEGINTGMEHQTAAEYAFETGDYKHVEELAVRAYEQAKAAGRNSICISSLFLRGRLEVQQNNSDGYLKIQKELDQFSAAAENPIIYGETQCAKAYLYYIAGEKEKIPQWIQEGRAEEACLLPEAEMIFYIIYGMCLIEENDYKKLLAVSDIMDAIFKKRVHVFGMIYTCIFRCVGYYKLYGTEKAAESVRDLLALCGQDHIITPLIEFGDVMKELIEASAINSIFLSEVRVKLRNKQKINKKVASKQGTVMLTRKEKEVMELIEEGLKTIEIAGRMQVSLNTVQTHMKSIYRKFKVNSKVNVIRVYKEWKTK